MVADLPKNAVGMAVGMTEDLCAAVGVGLFICILAPLDESELASYRYRLLPGGVRWHPSPA
jgi:hypothetical protein